MAANIGNRGLITRSIFTFATLQPMNSTDPTGGVQRPTLRLSTMMMPKWMGSSPS